MKKILKELTAILACLSLAACGAGTEPESAWTGIGPGTDLAAVTERTEYYDFSVETEGLFDLGLWEQNPEQYTVQLLGEGEVLYAPLGTQFAAGEPIQIWSETSSSGSDVWLYQADGNRELLLQGIPNAYASIDSQFQCYMDQDRNCYFYRTEYSQINGEYRYVGTLMKLLPSGEVLYKNTLDPGLFIEDIRQTEDGRVYMLLSDYENFKKVVKELDPDTGQMNPEAQIELNYGDIALGSVRSGEAGALALAGLISGDGYGIASADMEAQAASMLLYFYGTSYGWHDDSHLQDFQLLEDGAIEFLWTDKKGLGCFRERLRMGKVEKEPVVLRGVFFADTWLSEQVALFNQRSGDYHVVFEKCGYGNDLEDFSRLTSVQVGAGKGPDILCGDYLLHDYIDGMLEKGALEILNPYMEASGIREEDYFPLTFSNWRQGEKIYGVTPKMEAYYEEMDAEVLGSGVEPDIEALADALLAREGNEVYRKRITSGELLNSFLQGSESLWGMVDWEAGRCDFDVPLFGKLLRAAGKYGYDAGRELAPVIAYEDDLENFFYFNTAAEQEEKGRVSVGVLFEDGCHGVSLPLYTMAVNANSAHKEGAWEFIAFLLGEEVQYREKMYLLPVHRASFDKWLEWEIQYGSEVRYEDGHRVRPLYFGENTSEEKREAYKKAIEEVRPLPMGTAPILTIVQEEAEDYFSGSKSVEEVSKVINNRVQLYLDERK